MEPVGRTDTFRLKYLRFWQLTAWSAVAVIVWLSLTPSPPQPPGFLGWDKAQHFLAYASLSFWFGSVFGRSATWPIGLVLMGIGLEFLQACGGVRVMEPSDMTANSLGACAGWSIALTRAGDWLIWCESRLCRWAAVE